MRSFRRMPTSSMSELSRQVPDFAVTDHEGRVTRLSRLASGGALVLLVHPGLREPRSLELLAEYRDRALGFRLQGAQIAALSPDEPSALAFLRAERGLPFALLSDRDRSAISALGGLALGRESSGLSVLLLDRARVVRHHARAPLGSADELLRLVKRGLARGRTPAVVRLGAFLKERFVALRQTLAARQTRAPSAAGGGTRR